MPPLPPAPPLAICIHCEPTLPPLANYGHEHGRWTSRPLLRATAPSGGTGSSPQCASPQGGGIGFSIPLRISMWRKDWVPHPGAAHCKVEGQAANPFVHRNRAEAQATARVRNISGQWDRFPMPMCITTRRRDRFPTPMHITTGRRGKFPNPIHNGTTRRDQFPNDVRTGTPPT